MSAVGSSQAKNASGDDHDGRVLLLPPQLQILDLNVYIFAKTRNHYKLSPEMKQLWTMSYAAKQSFSNDGFIGQNPWTVFNSW